MLVIVQSGGANIGSLFFALQRLGVAAIYSSDAAVIKKASHVILPGVGAASAAMQQIAQHKLQETICTLTQPVLGICLGMQILFKTSAETTLPCLGIIDGAVEKIPPKPQLTVPHMGWNNIQIVRDTPLLNGIADNSYVYFIHSYAASVSEASCAISTHGIEFTAVLQQNNFFGTQFHPERSGKVGQNILRNFLEL